MEAIDYGTFNKVVAILKGVSLPPEVATAIIDEVRQHEQSNEKTYDKAICCSNCGKAKTITIKFGQSVSRGKVGILCDRCGCKV